MGNYLRHGHVLYRLRHRLRRLRHTHLPFNLPLSSITIIIIFILLLLLTLIMIMMAPFRQHPSHGLTAGVGVVDITPRVPVYLSGFASRTRPPARSVLLQPTIPLTARALALHSSTTTTTSAVLVLVSLDVIALPRNLSHSLYKVAFQRFGLTRATLRLCVTHTHSGPAVADALAPLSPTDPLSVSRILSYQHVLHLHVLRVIARALGDLQPVVMSYRPLSLAMAVNRRQVSEHTFLHNNSSSRGQTSTHLPVLLFHSVATTTTSRRPRPAQLRAAVFGYAAHPTVLTSGNAYSPDYPGVAIANLQARFPNSVWLFLNGCAGDQNIYPRGNLTHLVQHAAHLSDTIIKSLVLLPNPNPSISTTTTSTTTGPITPQFSSVHTTIQLPFSRRYSRPRLALKSAHGPAQKNAVRVLLRNLSPDGLTATHYPYPIAAWKLGPLRLVFLGGEPTIGYFPKLARLGVHWVVGYSEDVMGYVGTKSVILSGGREGGERAAWYYGLPASWNPVVESLILSAVQRLLKQLQHQ